MPDLILASASPRRAELLQQIGLDFQVQPADIDETPASLETPEHYVERLARDKALSIAREHPHKLVLGSDTSVIHNEEILGKPESSEQAVSMLQALSGSSHQVLTAVALAKGTECWSRVVVTDVTFRELEAAEISAYVASGEPMDKAGSYGIQGLGGIFVSSIRGSYSAVVGLPLQETAALLAQAGHPVIQFWPSTKESQR
ncbi:Maf-like protein YhdE [Marinobacter litoralis]|uniref:dTTP/UTP pyrophosphatase n=1 Tax=Marinobacter litoralis TaxID=187981 RepID=A0A3M2RFR0_9GAMM|nr:Maf family protein [Marinobacter litoralis]RMJ03999.1 Maf-like protein YhdE [Marinobacter litoralis]